MTDDIARRRTDALIRPAAPIVPDRSIAGRSLIAVVAIMTFLAALTAGGVQLVATAASEWSADVAGEVTVQVRPTDGNDIERQVERAVVAARASDGVASVEPWSSDQTERMLEPWLGADLDIRDLPIPRLIVIKLTPGAQPDFNDLRRSLAGIPGASLDDHRFWIQRLSAMAGSVVISGLVILGLMVTATALSVVFATRGAMAGNRDVVEVLHFIGAHDSFIAGEFQRHFLWLGLKGGLLGGFAAALVFGAAHLIASRYVATAGGEQAQALFGSFAMNGRGYLAIAGSVGLVAFMTSLTSRLTVHHVLRSQP